METICLSKIKYRKRKKLTTANNFFANNIKYDVYYNKIVFKNVGDLYDGKIMAIKKIGNKYVTTIDVDCDCGIYEIENSESNNDILTVYY